MQTLTRPNFLFLDEPTNHIDIEGREQLEASLLNTDAAVIVTSHDRDFIENVAERFLLIADGALKELTQPERYHAAPEATALPPDTQGSASPRAADLDDAGEDALARIVDLEALLEADRARKPKFQKPERQAAWAAEIAELYARLDD